MQQIDSYHVCGVAPILDDEKGSLKILLIGNSYTYYNDMPELLEGLMRENGVAAFVTAITKGGGFLDGCFDENDMRFSLICEALSLNRYDIAVFQEQSCRPFSQYDDFAKAVKKLKKTVNTPRTVLYATWGRKSGSRLLGDLHMTSEEMTNVLDARYADAARFADVECAHVGLAFLRFGKQRPELELYHPDMSHPSRLGSAIAAVELYKTFIGKAPQKYTSLGLSEDEMCALARVF